jgi:hypothetical protein
VNLRTYIIQNIECKFIKDINGVKLQRSGLERNAVSSPTSKLWWSQGEDSDVGLKLEA